MPSSTDDYYISLEDIPWLPANRRIPESRSQDHENNDNLSTSGQNLELNALNRTTPQSQPNDEADDSGWAQDPPIIVTVRPSSDRITKRRLHGIHLFVITSFRAFLLAPSHGVLRSVKSYYEPS